MGIKRACLITKNELVTYPRMICVYLVSILLKQGFCCIKQEILPVECIIWGGHG